MLTIYVSGFRDLDPTFPRFRALGFRVWGLGYSYNDLYLAL